jgi:rod shape determining protein RodA
MHRLPVIVTLIGASLILASSSLLILHSVAPQVFISQLGFFLAAALIAGILSRFDYQLYVFSPWPPYIISILLLLITLVLGSPIRGSTRWLNIFGFSFQTSEITKPLLIIFAATYLAHKLPRTVKELVIFLFLMAFPALLVFLQPDLGTAILIMVITAASIIGIGVGFKRIFITLAFIAILFPLGYSQLKPYQVNRLVSFINPDADPLGAGYNVTQSTIAVGSGKIFGRGLGQGTQSHLRFLPEKHTDFIFASLVEELGLIGGVMIIFSYLALCFGLIRAAQFASSEVGSVICLSSLGLILFQAVVNIGMNLGIMPITGITLPLVSSGGSSILSMGIMLGMCLSVALRPTSHKALLEIGTKPL